MIRNLKGIMLAVWLSSGVGVRVGLAVDESAKSDERIGLTNMVASNTYAGTRAENIGDGSLVSAWNAGDYAPQSVEFELEKKKNIITKMRLVPGQSPAGRTAHEVYAADSTGTYRMVARIEEYTSDGVPLVQEFLPPLHNVSKMMVKSVSSPSWIAWQEIEVYGIGSMAQFSPVSQAEARETEMFETAKKDAYSAASSKPLARYLSQGSKFSSEAKKVADEIAAYGLAQKGGRMGLQKYLTKYPDGYYSQSVRDKIAQEQRIAELKALVANNVKWKVSYQYETDEVMQIMFFRKNMWVTYKFILTGKVKQVDIKNETLLVQVSSATLDVPFAVSIKYLEYEKRAVSAYKSNALGKEIWIKYSDIMK
ncbi:hypothetical protein BIU88_08765 [Chlorobaculum limnaeum]|uniref:F5/8 type C domain-containing protein n=1 Tax=Chlorobaculum limnaeum TaxID=274537 RepID=A0A1D8D669_CHLLM|nr:hypothetical protein [Chlorobaculum limnaeum]AOS84214.1 hypothetical protein BIU88_08765 [Chlorobaculum limnaeum]